MTVAKEVSLLQRLMWILNTLFHQALAVISVYILWIIFFNYKADQQFTWHMALSTLAYVPVMGEAIVLFATDNVWSQQISRTTKYWLHGAIMFFSCILVTVGIALIIDEHASPHFTSIHGWTGLVSWVLVLLSQVIGLAAAKPQILGGVIPSVCQKFLHNLLGMLGYIFGIVSLGYGLEIGAFTFFARTDAKVTTYYVMGFTTFWAILAALQSAFNQMKTIAKIGK